MGQNEVVLQGLSYFYSRKRKHLYRVVISHHKGPFLLMPQQSGYMGLNGVFAKVSTNLFDTLRLKVDNCWNL